MADSEGLFAANHDRLFRYFCRAVGQAEMARDLTQEVFLRVSRTSIPAAADRDLYLVGERRAVATTSEAPPPTRVVEAVPFVPSGGIR